MTHRHLFGLFALATLGACGSMSIAPIVSTAGAETNSQLEGEWVSSDTRKESAVITPAGRGAYLLVYTDEDGKVGRFDVRLGRLGPHHVLDVAPVDPVPTASDVYRSLLVGGHWFIVLDSVTPSVAGFRMLEGDSLKAYLTRNPTAVPHTVEGKRIVLTGSTAVTRRFLEQFMGRPGVLPNGDGFWRRAR